MFHPLRCAIALWGLAGQAALISVSSGSVPAGTNFQVAVQFSGEGSQVSGLQFDLEFSPGLVVSPVPGPAGDAAAKVLSTVDLSPSKRRCLLVGLNQSTIFDGILLFVNVAVPAGAGKTQYTLHVSNSVATDLLGNEVALSAVDGAVTIEQVEPIITSVVNTATFLPGIVDGSWVAILGTGLSSTTRTWTLDEIVNGQLPLSLDGVSVTVGGLPAAISYISPTQLNVQVPITGRTGPVDVKVTNVPVGSAVVSGSLQRTAPELYVFPQADGKYVAALIARHDGGVDYLGPIGLFGGDPVSRPVNPGESLELYATGLGRTKPAVPAGRLFSGAAGLTDPITVTIGGMRAPVAFAGISAAGLYQINVTVPDLPQGDHQVVVEVNGIVSQQGVFVAVGP